MNAPAKTGLRVKSPVPSRYPAYRIVSEADELLATVPISASGDSGKLAHAMAAAPEMLDALKGLTHGLPELLKSIGYTDEENLIGKALAVIAKAEGAQ